MRPGAFTQQFGQKLRAERERLGISQEDLAFDAKLHRTHISLIERGKRSVRLETICRLAMALGIQPAQLMPKLAVPNRANRSSASTR